MSENMVEYFASDIGFMRSLLEKLFAKINECVGRVSLAQLLLLSEEVEESIFSKCTFINAEFMLNVPCSARGGQTVRVVS